jgi:hypothetical protein
MCAWPRPLTSRRGRPSGKEPQFRVRQVVAPARPVYRADHVPRVIDAFDREDVAGDRQLALPTADDQNDRNHPDRWRVTAQDGDVVDSAGRDQRVGWHPRPAAACRPRQPCPNRAVAAPFEVYARLALALVLVVALSGTVGALLLVPTVRDLTGTGYGRALLAKLVLVAVVAVLAWSARRRLTRSPGTVEPVARLEAMTLAAVLAVSAVLISLPTPAPAVPRIPPARHRPGRAPGHPRRPGRRRDRCQREPARDKTAGTR